MGVCERVSCRVVNQSQAIALATHFFDTTHISYIDGSYITKDVPLCESLHLDDGMACDTATNRC